MALIQGWMPPSRENYEKLLIFWQFAYPILGSLQWFISWYGMGKTSVRHSRLNLPGRAAWMTMEAPGFLTLLYVMRTLPAAAAAGGGVDEIEIDLPWQNRVLAGLFVLHYVNRALVFPLVAPAVAPIHAAVWAMALVFQLCNATCLAAWLAAYGAVLDQPAWRRQSPLPQFVAGLALFYLGLAGNWFHDEALREIRRKELLRRRRRHQSHLHAQQQQQQQQQQNSSSNSSSALITVDKHYEIPQAGLFKYLLYPHYLFEWIEWTGFWLAAGWSCTPARAFLVNEIFSMLPRAVNGKKWYIQKFGPEKIKNKWAVIPGVC